MTWSHLSLNYSAECIAAVRSLNLPLSRPWGTILPCPLPLWHFLLWHFFHPWTFPWYPKVLPGRLSLPVVTQKAHLPLKLHLPPSCCDPRFCSLSALNTNLQCPIAFMTDPSHCLALQNCRSKCSFLFSFAVLHTAPPHLPQWCIAGSFSTSHPVPQPPIK